MLTKNQQNDIIKAMTRKYLILIIILVSVFSFFSYVNAQVQNESIVLSLTPSSPRANENVTARLSSSSVNLNKSKISWILNGQTAIENVGQKNFSFDVGAAGSQTTIGVTIETLDGTILNKNATIMPADIDMLWEAYDTYVPPFYRGKTIAPVEGRVKVTAMPNSNNISGLSYAWNQDGDNMQNSSGYGKNYYLYKNSFLENTNTINVDVSDIAGNTIGQGSISIKPESPKILFYKKDPIFGTRWENVLGDGHIISQEGETIVAEPYFFSPKDLSSSDLKFKWSLGDNEIPTPDPVNEIGIKPETGQSGQSKITLSIDNIKSLFLSLSKDLNVNF